ncbi:uncharacterized protein LOC124430717 [Vespa crabro]|uniref:uncharacterized protein LOC124430717 n=1 Tax=Vespa crabro TaxID=7445 RepID=UPI001F006B4F|nr:uncharacterized protein LOC124430717 [Vespa crabro]XP_046833643.1 uncharacterized protein LOC124430717 [Vespa crabro]XP_046833644.1 uncharacterized protein LOC124430717 [Vespa crabro]
MKIEETSEERELFESLMNKLYHDVNFRNKIAKQSYDEMRKELEDMLGERLNLISDIYLENFYYSNFLGNHDRPSSEKPDWLDLKKFQRGQHFARNNLAGLFIGKLYGLLCLLCHAEGLQTMIMTQKSHTPYLAFKRYLSTSQRIRNWYTEDPWCEDTRAYKDIQTVKRMHLAVSKKISELDCKEMESMSTIKDPYCPAFRFITDDFSMILPPDSLLARTYVEHSKHLCRNLMRINQIEMNYTLFGFMGLPILFPHRFGIYPVIDEDLENFCYVWRCIGYLLGVDDKINICRGSLKDVKGRCQRYIDELVKPALQRLEPQWEHMIRCIIEGNSYFMTNCNFETVILCVADIINIEMPSLYFSLNYYQRIVYYLHKYFLQYGLQYSFIRRFVNKFFNSLLDGALNFDDSKIAELKKKSMDSLLHVSVGK